MARRTSSTQMAATFGAGYTQACVVDVGAQKTSVTCVEDGLCIDDSRINLKFGGYDVTETFVKMMLFDNFPYQDINLQRRYDFLLAEELKIKHCTLAQADISVQLYQFHVRAPNQPTRKYQFKTYDEVILSPMGFYEPAVFDNSTKLRGRRRLIDRSYNSYDVNLPDDPTSAAQLAILELIQPSVSQVSAAAPPHDFSTPSKEKPRPFDFVSRADANGTPGTSNAASPAPEGASTPVPAPHIFTGGKDAVNGASPAPSGRNGGTPAPANAPAAQGNSSQAAQQQQQAQQQAGASFGASFASDAYQRSAQEEAAEQRDSVLPVAPLDIAILTSIQNAARGDEKKVRDMLGSIMVIGGGAKVPQFAALLEDKLKARRPDLFDRILVSRSARDMDEQVVVWKGASVFAKLPTNDSWITGHEFERLGSRAIHHKTLWQY